MADTAGYLIRDLLTPLWRAEQEPVVSVDRRIKKADLPLFRALAEEYAALVYVNFLQSVLLQMRTLVICAAGMYVFILCSISVYPFEPHPALQAALAREAFVMRSIVAVSQLHRERAAPVRVEALVRELGTTSRLVREGLAALAGAGLAVETKQGGWLLSRDPSRITLAEVRAAGRASLRFPAQAVEDEVGVAIASSLTRADEAAAAALGESLESFLRLFEAAPVEGMATPEPRPLGVGQSAHKPA